jgi:hypothetical protein
MEGRFVVSGNKVTPCASSKALSFLTGSGGRGEPRWFFMVALPLLVGHGGGRRGEVRGQSTLDS